MLLVTLFSSEIIKVSFYILGATTPSSSAWKIDQADFTHCMYFPSPNLMEEIYL